MSSSTLSPDEAIDTADLAAVQGLLDGISAGRYCVNEALGADPAAAHPRWELFRATDRLLRRDVLIRLCVARPVSDRPENPGATPFVDPSTTPTSDTAATITAAVPGTGAGSGAGNGGDVPEDDALSLIRARISWARTLARVSDPRIARIYDAALEEVDGTPYGLIITSHFAGTTLTDIADPAELGGPAQRGRILRAVEAAAQVLRAADLPVGVLHPSDVIMTADGVRLVTVPGARRADNGPDTLSGIRAVLDLDGRSDQVSSEPRSTGSNQAKPASSTGIETLGSGAPSAATALATTDTMTTGQPSESVVPPTGPAPAEPKQPHEFNHDTRRTADRNDAPEPATVREESPMPTPGDDRLADDTTGPGLDEDDYYTGEITSGDDDFYADDDGRRDTMSEPKRNRIIMAIGVLLGLLALVVIGWFGGILLGKVTGSASGDGIGDGPPAGPTAGVTSTAAASAPPDGTGKPIPITGATLFDPPPGDGQENPNRIANAYDGNPGTVWPLLQYGGSAKFGNIKPGVGLILDLGTEQTVTAVKLTTPLPGATVEIRSGTGTTGGIDDFKVISKGQQLQAETTFKVDAGTKTRYVLVWFTELVPVDGKFTASLAEVQVIG